MPEHLKNLAADAVNLARFLVPSAGKRDILAELSRIGFHRKRLFPDLEGLSHFLNWEWKRTVEWDTEYVRGEAGPSPQSVEPPRGQEGRDGRA